MQKVKYNFSFFIPIFVFCLFYLSILVGFYLNEDSLGGAKADFIYHYKISLKFTDNFNLAFNEYGTNVDGMNARNSPVFWIIVSWLNNFISVDFLRLINSSVAILISILFYNCLSIRFVKIKKITLVFLSCVIFLSPTIRSVSIWPYTLSWGLVFLLLSILFYLKYENTQMHIKNNIYAFITVFFTAISAYLHPSFAVFFIFYVIKFFRNHKLGIKIFYILSLSLILATPSFYYIFTKDFLNSFHAAQGVKTSVLQSFNISNKFLIISSMIFYFIIPILNFKIVIHNIKKLKFIEYLFIFVVCAINIYVFNYPAYDSGLGGGFFYKLSNILLGNNLLFYLSSLISIIIIYSIIAKNFSNYILLILLFAFTPQLTIYNKYYDPLILIVFSILINFNFEDHFFKKKFKFFQLYIISIFYLFMGIFKSQIY